MVPEFLDLCQGSKKAPGQREVRLGAGKTPGIETSVWKAPWIQKNTREAPVYESRSRSASRIHKCAIDLIRRQGCNPNLLNFKWQVRNSNESSLVLRIPTRPSILVPRHWTFIPSSSPSQPKCSSSHFSPFSFQLMKSEEFLLILLCIIWLSEGFINLLTHRRSGSWVDKKRITVVLFSLVQGLWFQRPSSISLSLFHQCDLLYTCHPMKSNALSLTLLAKMSRKSGFQSLVDSEFRIFLTSSSIWTGLKWPKLA